MQKFSLETSNFSDWTLERDFSTMHRAMQFGLENMAHNDWRVVERRTGEVVHTHNGIDAITNNAVLEERRFQHNYEWRERFANQRAAEIREQQNLRERQRTTERQTRLRGFQFVGDGPIVIPPDVAAERRGQLPQYNPDDDDEWFPPVKKKQKVNWLKEGF